MPTLLLIDETGARASPEARRIEGRVEGLRVRVAHSLEEGAALALHCRPDLALVYPAGATEDWLLGVVQAALGERDRGFDRHRAINQLAAILSGLRAMESAVRAGAAPEADALLRRHVSPLLQATRELTASLCAPGIKECSR